MADVHGHDAALAAALAQLGDADLLVHCGDVAGYYPWLAETAELLRARQVVAVRGNHDAYALGREPRSGNPQLQLTVAETRTRLQPAERDWLAALPPRAVVPASGTAIMVWHGRPDDDEAGMPDDDAACAELLAAAGVADDGVVCCGHTHVTAVRRLGGRLLLNPGSLGYPRAGDAPGVLVYDTATRQVARRPVAYDRAAVRVRLDRTLPDGDLRRMLHSRLAETA